MSLLVNGGGADLRLTEHAVERYAERVRPSLERPQVEAELRRVLPHASWGERPDWHYDGGGLGAIADRWLLLGDGIAFAVQGRIAVTCITRSVRSEKARARSNAFKQQRRRSRAHARRGLGARPERGRRDGE